MPFLARSSSGSTSRSSGMFSAASASGSWVNWITRSRWGTPPSGMSMVTQLCGRRGPVSTSWPAWKGPIQSPTNTLPLVLVIRCSSYSSW